MDAVKVTDKALAQVQPIGKTWHHFGSRKNRSRWQNQIARLEALSRSLLGRDEAFTDELTELFVQYTLLGLTLDGRAAIIRKEDLAEHWAAFEAVVEETRRIILFMATKGEGQGEEEEGV